MSTSIISATNPHKGTTTSDAFAYALDDIIQASVTNPAGGLVTPCQVTLQLSSDGGITYQSVDSKRGGMGNGDGSTLLLIFRLADYAGKAIWTHGRLVFAGNTAQSQLGVAVTAAGDGATWTTGGGGGTTASLISTPVKTANYSASAGDFVPCDSTSGDVTVTLPAAPADGTVIGVKHITGGGNCTVIRGGSDTFYGSGQTSLVVTLAAGQGWILLYHAATSRWYVTVDELGLNQLDTRYLLNSISASRLPTTGLTITQHSGGFNVPSGTSGTITCDLSLSDWQIPAACTGAFTIAFSNATVGQQFTVVLQQASSGGPYAVTWPSVTWMGAPYTAPTMPSTASAKLSATFKCISAGVYLGWWLGNSAA